MKVHEKIRSLREAKNWSQEDMAAKLNMSVNGYSKIERGETKTYIPKLEQIAEIFEVDLIELIPIDGKNIYLFNNNGDGCHIFNSESQLIFENEKLHLELKYKTEIIEQQKQQIADLKDYIELLKSKIA